MGTVAPPQHHILNNKNVFLFHRPDQEKADFKTGDTGEVRKGQETTRAKEVWQKGWSLFKMALYVYSMLFYFI